jgi:hypothetical protein
VRLVGKVKGDYFLGTGIWGGDGDCFPCINQRYGRWGQVRGEEVPCCQLQKSTKNLFLVGFFLTC